jgi:tetratricopeptide (TPR) repeat protein
LRALEINKRSYGEDHVNYARTLYHLSIILMDLGDYENAIKGFLKVLDI